MDKKPSVVPGMTMMQETVVGLSIPDLMAISEKLQIMRLDTKDLIEFLDRDKVQLFAEKIDEIKTLKSKLEKVSKIVS